MTIQLESQSGVGEVVFLMYRELDSLRLVGELSGLRSNASSKPGGLVFAQCLTLAFLDSQFEPVDSILAYHSFGASRTR